MNVLQTMEAVHRYVPTRQGRESVAVGLDTDWVAMAGPVKVSFNCSVQQTLLL